MPAKPMLPDAQLPCWFLTLRIIHETRACATFYRAESEWSEFEA